MTRMRYMLYVWLPESQKRQASTDLNAIHELALRSVWSTNRPTPLLLLPGDGDTVHRDTRVDVPSFPDNHKRSPTPSFSTLPPPRRPESSSTLLSGSAKASASAFSSSPLSPSSSRAADRGVRRSGEKPASSSQTLPRFSRMPCSLYAIEFSCRADWVDFVVGVQAAVFSEPMLTRGRALWMLAATRVLQRCGSRSSPVSAQGPMSDPNGTSFPMDHAGSQVTKTSSVPTRATDDNVSVSDGEAVRFRGLPREMERLKNGSSRLERFHWQGQESVADQRRQQTDPPPPPSPSPPPPPSSHASSPPATPLLTLSSALTRMSCVSTFRPMPAPDTTHEAGLMSAEASFPIVRAEADGGLDGDKGYPTSRSLETASLPAPQQIIALAPSPRFALRDHASREMDQWEEDPKKGCSTSPLHRRFAVPQ